MEGESDSEICVHRENSILTEHIGNRFLFDVGVEVPIAAALLVRLVTDKIIDDPLIHSGSSQATYETVPEYMVTAKRFPLRTCQRPSQVIVRFVFGHR